MTKPLGVEHLPSGSTVTVWKNKDTWPARPTGRNDIHVIWKGPAPAPKIVKAGTTGMLDNIDSWWATP